MGYSADVSWLLLLDTFLRILFWAPLLAAPTLYAPVWSLHAVIIIIPVSIVTLVELIGHLQDLRYHVLIQSGHTHQILLVLQTWRLIPREIRNK